MVLANLRLFSRVCRFHTQEETMFYRTAGIDVRTKRWWSLSYVGLAPMCSGCVSLKAIAESF